MNIRKIKLNLLIAFDALMKTGSVSLAAKECHVTQAAMSNSLKQLREMFADPLFIRESKGMSPTSKAIMLHAKIRDALASIEQVFMDAQFNPKISKREFHLALSEHGENLILPKLYAYLATHAPFIKIRVMSYTETMQDVERLSSDVDMAIGTPLPVSSQIHSEVLLRKQVSV
jgi:DNA-binding transcriptional LysR family regulator